MSLDYVVRVHSVVFYRSLTPVTIINCTFGVLFLQAEDGIRYLVRSRGLGDVYKRQGLRRFKKLIVANKEELEQLENKTTETGVQLIG